MTAYHWVEFERFRGELWSGLLPVDEPNPYSMRCIASIYPRGDGIMVASYAWRDPSGGHKPASWAYRKTRQGAKQWIERQLSRFWNQPEIVP